MSVAYIQTPGLPAFLLRSPQSGPARLLTVYIVTGLVFMLLPGTFLGVWNLIAISEASSSATMAPSWIQAHGHAQLFGWIGTFILGIGFYSIPRMRGVNVSSTSLGYAAWVLWTLGVWMRWAANIYLWHWKIMLPISAIMELSAFLLFLKTTTRHRRSSETANPAPPLPIWIVSVLAGTAGFLLVLVINAVGALQAVWSGSPAIPPQMNSNLLTAAAFAFIVPTIWGFSARWLPVFLGLRAVRENWLTAALVWNFLAVLLALMGQHVLAAWLLPAGAVSAILALRLVEKPVQAPKTLGVHSSFPVFVRLAYAWLLVATVLGILAVYFDNFHGYLGASRHALTVGFFSTMVFAIGQRVLPAFSGMRLLFSPRLMLASLLLLQAGCALRVGGEILAYEGYFRPAWQVLPVSACIELGAVAVFALNLVLSFTSQPPHEKILAGQVAN